MQVFKGNILITIQSFLGYIVNNQTVIAPLTLLYKTQFVLYILNCNNRITCFIDFIRYNQFNSKNEQAKISGRRYLILDCHLTLVVYLKPTLIFKFWVFTLILLSCKLTWTALHLQKLLCTNLVESLYIMYIAGCCLQF